MSVTSTASAASQSALYAILAGDPTLSQVPCGVYDSVPVGAAFPYVVVGDAVERAANRIGKPAREVTATLHVFGRSGQDWPQAGYAQVQKIAAQLDVLLDNVTLPETNGWVFDAIDLLQHNVVRDPDGETRHIAAQYKLTLEWA